MSSYNKNVNLSERSKRRRVTEEMKSCAIPNTVVNNAENSSIAHFDSLNFIFDDNSSPSTLISQSMSNDNHPLADIINTDGNTDNIDEFDKVYCSSDQLFL